MLKINPYNNNQQSFGMAYRVKGDASKRIAENLAQYSEKTQFIDNVLKPLDELKTKVIADGDRVLIEHPVTKNWFEVTDYRPWMNKNSYGKSISYPLNTIESNGAKGEFINHTINYTENQNRIGKPAWDANFIYDGILRKHVSALEVAKDFDKELAKENALKVKNEAVAETVETIAQKIDNLFA